MRQPKFNVLENSGAFSSFFFDTLLFLVYRSTHYLKFGCVSMLGNRLFFKESPVRYVILSVALLTMIAGCAQVPKPATYPMSFQKKMQAGHHWNLLAQDVAEQVRLCCSEGFGCDFAQGRPLYVEAKSGVFGKAFHEMLIAHLVRPQVYGVGQWNGCLVVEEKTEDSLVLRYNVQLIKHRSNRFNRPMPGTFTALATGLAVIRNNTPNTLKAWGIGAGVLADIWAGSSTTLPHHEVLITTSVLNGNQYLFGKADLYYINDPDFLHYLPGHDAPAVRFAVKDDVCDTTGVYAVLAEEDLDLPADPVAEKVVIERVVQEKPVAGPVVYFEFDRTEILPVHREELKAFADAMKGHYGFDILVIGHADSRGSVAYNEKLSLNRAFAVRNVLEAFGIERHRINIYGSGKITTIDQHSKHLPKSVDRRVIVKVQERGATLRSM